jgi:cell division protein FtsW (lipid II flippase)
MQTDAAAGRRTLLLFALASLAAVAAGAATLAATGLPAGSWLRNPAAWVLGALLGSAVAAGSGGPRLRTAFLLAAPIGLAATFLAAPVDGIHRWIDIGPLHVNVAALLLPPMIVAAARAGIAAPLAAGAAAATAALLALQPDASQASAFAAAIALLLLRTRARPGVRAGLAIALAGTVAAAWLRPDTLQPVAEVEGIFGLAWTVAPVLAGLAAVALAAAAAAPLPARRGKDEGAALALCAYFAVTALAPLAGAYPVPLVGLGMSFPVGWWLGVGLLCARVRDEEEANA